MKFVLSVDLGTTSMKAVLFDQRLSAVARAKVDYQTDYPAPGWAEQDVGQWWAAMKAVVHELFSNDNAPDPSDIAVLAVDAMTPTVIPVDANGRALRKALIWMDRRAETESARIDDALGEVLFRISGNHNDPSNFAPKVRWIRDNEPEVYKKTHQFLFANAYLVYHLTGRFTMDATQCGLSQLCDTRQGVWSDELIAGSGLDREKLPDIVESTEIVGTVRTEAANELGLSVDTAVIAGAMDNVAAGLGAGVAGDRELYISAGTAANVCLSAAEPHFHPSFHVYRHIAPDRWIHSAGVDYGGAGYKWFAKLIDEGDYAALDERAERATPGTKPLLFLPYMVGQRAPLWNSHTRGVLFGLDPSMTDADMARAFMEGNVFGVRRIIELTRELGVAPSAGRLTGGCSESRVYSQIFADVLGIEILRIGEMDTATLGSAMAGAYAAGFFDDFASMTRFVSVRAEQHPNPSLGEYYDRAYDLFALLYAKLEPLYEELSALRSEKENP